jgi:hypothetical protein
MHVTVAPLVNQPPLALHLTTTNMTNEHTPLLSGPIPAENDNLSRFRRAIGINVNIQDGDVESARQGAKGMYKEVIINQRWCSRQYYFTDVIMYIALGSQIVIGAALAALGPLSKLHPTSITILGITNTSIAGVLALLKGQGLPDRLRKDQFEMRKVQDFIEETEARLVLAGDTLTLDEVDDAVQKVFLKFNAARDTAEMNRPENYGQQPEGPMVARPSLSRPGADLANYPAAGQSKIMANGDGKSKDTGAE